MCIHAYLPYVILPRNTQNRINLKILPSWILVEMFPFLVGEPAPIDLRTCDYGCMDEWTNDEIK